MYPSQQSQPPPYGQDHQGYPYDQQQQAYHQRGYPPPPPQAQQQQQQRGPAGGYPGQGPKPGHGGRNRASEPRRGQAQPQGRQRNPQPKKQQPQRQAQQPKPQASRARRPAKHHSEISLCIKYTLFFANFFFWLAGCGCIAAGLWAWSDRGTLGDLQALTSSSPLVDPVLWFIVIGAVIFLLATFGCIGALRENITLLKIYSGLLGLILLLEIGGGVAIYLYRSQIEDKIVGSLSDLAITNYRANDDFQDIVDALQTGLLCCGVNGYNDWDMNIYFNCSEKQVGNNRNLEACGVPFSCCIRDPDSDVINTQCGYGVRSKTDSEIRSMIHSRGCVASFKTWLQTNLVVVAIAAGVIVLVEVFGFCFSTSLVSDIKRQKGSWQQ